MTAEEFDALNFHKGMVVHYLEPKTVNTKIPTKILKASIARVEFNGIERGGGVLFQDSKGYYTFIHYSRIVSIE